MVSRLDLNEHDIVKLNNSGYKTRKGSKGTIVFNYNTYVFEVEFKKNRKPFLESILGEHLEKIEK